MAKLQRDLVIRAALDLLNEVGVDGLTTRRLAERLGVQQPALYWHFKNKRALLDALAEAMIEGDHIERMPRPGDDWRSFLGSNARSFRRALLAYRDGARIHAGTRPSERQSDAVEAQLRLLLDAGFTMDDAIHASVAIGHFTVGAVLEQQAAESDADERRSSGSVAPVATSKLLKSALQRFDRAGPEVAFEQGLNLILDGLGEKLRAQRRRKS